MSRLSNFPIMFFAIVMGFGGFSMAIRKISAIFELNSIYFDIFKIVTTAIFTLILIIYLAKVFMEFDEVKKEFNHQIRLNFFGAIPISLLILANLWQNSVAYEWLFYIGLILQTYITFRVVAFWINQNLEIKHSNPAWFIPVVGNLIVVLASSQNQQWLWYYFSIGLFFWVILFSIMFYRILFHDQLAQKFMPTLFIMIAPPAVGFLGYCKLVGFDATANIMLNLTIFFSFLVLYMYRNFLKLKFFLSWWAFTFPSAAASIAVLEGYQLSNNDLLLYIGISFFVALCVMIVFISYHTIKNIVAKNICVME